MHMSLFYLFFPFLYIQTMQKILGYKRVFVVIQHHYENSSRFSFLVTLVLFLCFN